MNTQFFVALILSLVLNGVQGQRGGSCTDIQIEAQANKFLRRINQSVYWTACGGKKWLTQFHELVPEGDRTIMDIGCNKGYESGLFFDLLVPELGLTPETMYRVHQQALKGTEGEFKLKGSLCGACRNCREKADRGSLQSSSKHKIVNVHCFEPSTTNFAALKNVEKQYKDLFPENGAFWHLHNTAMSNFTGEASFPKECGTTLCSFHNEQKDMPMVMVPVTTVDDFIALNSIKHVDILKIDTEGNDPSVLFGSVLLIKQRRVDLLYFEYHQMGLWKDITLESMVNWLAAFDYVCYIEGRPTLTRLTGCWTPSLEFRRWSNVVCTHRQSYLYEPMESITFLAADVQKQ